MKKKPPSNQETGVELWTNHQNQYSTELLPLLLPVCCCIVEVFAAQQAPSW